MNRFLRATVAALLLAASLAATTAAPTLHEAVAAAMTGQSRALGSSLADAGAGVEVNVQRQADGWAFGSTVIKAPRREGAYPEGALFLARLGGGGAWQVGLDGSTLFAELATAAPEQVVSKGEKETFGSNARHAVQQVDTGLALPYAAGASWRLIGGPHGWSGQPRPWSSLDLDSRAANRDVLAAQSGRAYWMCSNGGHIRVIHDNGWTTEYYHLLDEIRPDGERVAMGAYLGRTSTRIPCGGSAGSNHVHFALKSGSSWTPVQDKVIGGWRWFEGGQAYDGGGCRGTDCRYVGGWFHNYGPENGRQFANDADHTIADLGSAESPITVSGVSGNAPAALEIYADVHHGWRGDLRLDLIAPDGRVHLLRSPAPSDDGTIIHETYVRDASASPANGVWKLRATDVDGNHAGYIDAWRMTF
ncbi:MAG: peptidoglycan DD-metalloendopeptidase family protein [Thermoactinospora sp.]|nr:peptidoglycan DD-metalloendopeptidase family protein [Thermoactinospora sp.]